MTYTSYCIMRIKGGTVCRAFSIDSGTCRSLIYQSYYYCCSSFQKMFALKKTSKII